MSELYTTEKLAWDMIVNYIPLRSLETFIPYRTGLLYSESALGAPVVLVKNDLKSH